MYLHTFENHQQENMEKEIIPLGVLGAVCVCDREVSVTDLLAHLYNRPSPCFDSLFRMALGPVAPAFINRIEKRIK